ncbi:MAG: hypothetical protein ACRDYE_00915, partial [Acidimicrobiales bacterium]
MTGDDAGGDATALTDARLLPRVGAAAGPGPGATTIDAPLADPIPRLEPPGGWVPAGGAPTPPVPPADAPAPTPPADRRSRLIRGRPE